MMATVFRVRPRVSVMIMMNRDSTTLHQPPTVLIASDNVVMSRTMADRLRRAGHRVRSAHSPTDVLMSMNLEMPDLVVLHPGPKFSGPILYQRIRSDERTRHVPVLLVAAPSVRERFTPDPAPELFASKPVKIDVLASRVQGLLGILPGGCDGGLRLQVA